jgi:hypothetical protein
LSVSSAFTLASSAFALASSAFALASSAFALASSATFAISLAFFSASSLDFSALLTCSFNFSISSIVAHHSLASLSCCFASKSFSFSLFNF